MVCIHPVGAMLCEDDRYHLSRCPVVCTPGGGAHLYLRAPESVKGKKYAMDESGKCLIETRGDGHFVVAPGSPPNCHQSGKPYRLLRTGWFDGASTEFMPMETFHTLTIYAATLNKYIRPTVHKVVGDLQTAGSIGNRPGDHFNGRIAWNDVLGPHGWKTYQTVGGTTFWTRPGKSTGISASTGFCRGPSGTDLFYVFSTNAAPFEAEISYSR